MPREENVADGVVAGVAEDSPGDAGNAATADTSPADAGVFAEAALRGGTVDRKPDDAGVEGADQRFLCAICLDTVSDEPVVTRCGHLYCWPCLYHWLAPGMLPGEAAAAFGTHDWRRNQGGGARSDGRRCCPVCKMACTVDSVIPIYIHVHAEEGALPPSDAPRDDFRNDRRSARSDLDLSGVDEASRPGAVASAAAATSVPGSLPGTAGDDLDLGLRRRRGSGAAGLDDGERRPGDDQQSFCYDSPTRGARQNAFNGDDAGAAAQTTPIRCNSSGARDSSDTLTPVADVPSRPTPTGRIPPHENGRIAPPSLDSDSGSEPPPPLSPFRVALRPRARQREDRLTAYSYRAYPNSHRPHGRLTSALLGMVESFDNLDAGTARQQAPAHPAGVPPLHRRDGRRGGIRGVAGEPQGAGADGHRDGMGSSGEDSSMAMAREFLSRLVSYVDYGRPSEYMKRLDALLRVSLTNPPLLFFSAEQLLILACFVILCLLLF